MCYSAVGGDVRTITKLVLMVHPVPCDDAEAERFLALWSQFLASQAQSEEIAVCLLSNERPAG